MPRRRREPEELLEIAKYSYEHGVRETAKKFSVSLHTIAQARKKFPPVDTKPDKEQGRILVDFSEKLIRVLFYGFGKALEDIARRIL